MSFQTVLSLVGVAFTAFELYQRFRPKSSSGSAQNTISPQSEPKHSGGDRESGVANGAKLEAPTSVAPTSETRETPSVQKSEWSERSRSDSEAGAKLRARTKGL